MRTDVRTRIGSRIREIRERKGLTQGQLAQRCGIIQTTVSKIEQGRFSVSIDLLGRILDAMDAELEVSERK